MKALGKRLYDFAYTAGPLLLAAYFMVVAWDEYGWGGVLGILALAVVAFVAIDLLAAMYLVNARKKANPVGDVLDNITISASQTDQSGRFREVECARCGSQSWVAVWKAPSEYEPLTDDEREGH